MEHCLWGSYTTTVRIVCIMSVRVRRIAGRDQTDLGLLGWVSPLRLIAGAGLLAHPIGLELDPKSVEAYAWYAALLRYVNRPEQSLEMLERALALDHVNGQMKFFKLVVICVKALIYAIARIQNESAYDPASSEAVLAQYLRQGEIRLRQLITYIEMDTMIRWYGAGQHRAVRRQRHWNW